MLIETVIIAILLWLSMGGIAYQWCRKDELVHNPNEFESGDFRKWNLPFHLIGGPISLVLTTMAWLVVRYFKFGGTKREEA